MQTLAQQRQQTTTAAIVAFVLWATTAVLGIFTIVYSRAVVLRTYLRFVPDGANALSLLNIIIMLIMAFFFVAAVIGGAEYHRTHYGSPESWRLFARVLALEIGILLLPLFL
jgi:hypothetical protein